MQGSPSHGSQLLDVAAGTGWWHQGRLYPRLTSMDWLIRVCMELVAAGGMWSVGIPTLQLELGVSANSSAPRGDAPQDLWHDPEGWEPPIAVPAPQGATHRAGDAPCPLSSATVTAAWMATGTKSLCLSLYGDLDLGHKTCQIPDPAS